ncbi:SMI1/KNR4 family protein [Deinococcus apachensis]|uniref:SMI1/KNR4 family protein n=1 Tax=Deinococcus apachensis TaxID=309886 RepID=UPI00316AE8DC
MDSRPPGAVRPVTFSPAWFPFASDGGGNGLAVDLNPGPAGTLGQVITFGPDELTRLVLAPSLPAFLDWVADQIEAGRVTLEGNDMRLDGASSFLDRVRTLV